MVEKEVVEVEKIVEKEKVVEKVVVQEKIVNVLNAEGEALTEYNAALVNQRAQLGEQLEGQKAATQAAQNDVSAVMAKLAALQSRVCGSSLKRGEDTDAAFEEALKRKKDKEKRIKKRLEKKRRAAQEAEQGRLAAEAEREAVELELQEAALEMDEREREFRREKKKLKRKILEGKNEIEDLHDEFQREREMLQDNVREANRDAQLWRQVCELVLDKNLVDRVWQRSEYDPREDKWILPEMLTGEAAVPRSQLSSFTGHGADATCGRGCLRAAGVAVAARRDGPRRSSEAAVAAARRGRPRRRRSTSIVLAAVGRLHGRAARGVLAAFLERDPVAADVLAAGLDAAALETVIQSRRLAGRRRPASTAEEAREVAGGCWWARGGGRRPSAAAVGGLAGAAQVGGLAAAASKPPSQKPPRPKKKAVGGLAGAAVGALLVRPNDRSAAWLARRRRATTRYRVAASAT